MSSGILANTGAYFRVMTAATVMAYINSFPEPAKSKLLEIRSIIMAAVPEAEECISYGMPAIRLKKVLVFYAAWKTHIGFYPTAAPIKEFAAALSAYSTSKGAVQFPLEKPLPAELITQMTLFRKEAVFAGKKKA